MAKKKDMIGQIVGQWEIIEDQGIQSVNCASRVFKARCIHCGYIRERATKLSLKTPVACNHHHRTTWTNIKIRQAYENMKARCYNPNNTSYKYYGGRGITICDEWLKDSQKFDTWCVEHGADDGMSIDRIDGNGPYSPDNCRWVTVADNNRNKETVQMIEFDGEMYSIPELSKKLFDNSSYLVSYRKNHSNFELMRLISKYRKDPNGEYANNRERRITVDGETKSIYAWERTLGVDNTHYLSNYAKRRTDEEVANRIKYMITGDAMPGLTKEHRFTIHGMELTISDILKITPHFSSRSGIIKRIHRDGFSATQKFLNTLISEAEVKEYCKTESAKN